MKLSDFPEIMLVSSNVSDGNMKFAQGNPKETLENRIKFLNKVGISLDNVVDTNVQHGVKIQRVGKNDLKKGAYEDSSALKVDGLITDEIDVYLFLTIADCLPISIYDPKNKAISLVHGGWKGLDEEIISKAISKMQTEFNSNPKDLIVYIGPSIGPCHYRKDLWQQAEDQLINIGVLKENIENSRICTYENAEYFSHRKADDEKLIHDYRFATVLGIKN